MSTRLWLLSVVSLALHPGASPAAGAQSVRDSAGIRISENTKPAWNSAGAWRLASTPSVDIGRLDGPPEYQLHNTMGAVRLSDGTLVLAQMTTSQLRYYDSTGKFLRSAGRKGEGPAEFRQLMGVSRIAGDSVIGSNSRDRWEVFSSTGNYARSVVASPRSATLWFDDGSAIVEDYAKRSVVPRNASRWTDSCTYELVDANGVTRHVIAAVPMWEQTRNAGRAMHIELGPRLGIATDGNRLFIGFSDQYSIRVFNRSGKVERIIRRAWTPHVVTKTERDAFITAYTTPNRENIEPGATIEGIKALRLRNLETTTIASTLPAHGGFLADRLGNIWVREPMVSDFFPNGGWARVPPVETHWSVFDSTGRWLGDLTMPARFRAMTIDANVVTGLSLDEDDVEHVRTYRIMKPGR